MRARERALHTAGGGGDQVGTHQDARGKRTSTHDTALSLGLSARAALGLAAGQVG